MRKTKSVFGHLNHTPSIAVMRVYGLGKITHQQCGPPENFYLAASVNVNLSDALLQTLYFYINNSIISV